jgi:hypothetical protein
VEAVVFPGVDGDLAGIVCAEESEKRLLQTLGGEAAAAGFQCSAVDESAFADGLAPLA